MRTDQFQTSVKGQAVQFLVALSAGNMAEAESKISDMDTYWLGAVFAAQSLNQDLIARFPRVFAAWTALFWAWSDVKGTEKNIEWLRSLAVSLRDAASEAIQ